MNKYNDYMQEPNQRAWAATEFTEYEEEKTFVIRGLTKEEMEEIEYALLDQAIAQPSARFAIASIFSKMNLPERAKEVVAIKPFNQQ